MRRTAVSFAALATLIAPLPAAVDAQALDDPELTEWEVPYPDSRPRDPAVAPDGRVWFCGQSGAYIAVLDPETGEFTQYDTDGVRPHNLLVDPDGIVWYAGNAANAGSEARHIGRLDPQTGEIEKFMLPDERAADPHTLIFDSQGDIWFTVQGGNFIGKFWPETGEFRLVESMTVEGSRRGNSSRPYGIVMDSNDRPWIALFNTNHIGTVDPETFAFESFELPERALPRRIAITSDDILWYGDWTRGTLGRLDPATGEVREFPLPGGEGSRPYGMLADDSDRCSAQTVPVIFVEIAVGHYSNRIFLVNKVICSCFEIMTSPSAPHIRSLVKEQSVLLTVKSHVVDIRTVVISIIAK